MRKTGDRSICVRCGLEIEWWTKKLGGWTDRGNNTHCPDGRKHKES